MTTRDRIVLVAVLAAALVGAFWFTVLKPKQAEATKLDAQIAQQQSDLQKARAATAAGRTAKAQYERDYAAMTRLGKAVPVDDGVASLVYELEHAAQGAKVDFRALSSGGAPGAPTPSAGTAAAATTATATVGVSELPFSLTFDGGYFQMQRFLERVQRLVRLQGKDLAVTGRLLALEGVSLAAGRDGFPDVKATVTAKAYTLPAATASGTAGSTPGAAAAAGTTASSTTTSSGATG